MFGSKFQGIAMMGLALAIMTGAVLSTQDRVADTGKPAMISLSGDKIAACRLKSVETVFGFLGCNPVMAGRAGKSEVVRLVGGSRFVSYRGSF